MRRATLGLVAALLLSVGPTPPMRSQPPSGGNNCMPLGYTLHCKHTCTYVHQHGGECISQGSEAEGTYCLATVGVEPWNSCHDGSSDECCLPAPML